MKIPRKDQPLCSFLWPTGIPKNHHPLPKADGEFTPSKTIIRLPFFWEGLLFQGPPLDPQDPWKYKGFRLPSKYGWEIPSQKHERNVRSHGIHPRKLTCLVKRDYFKRKCIFQPLIFRGHVCFPVSIYLFLKESRTSAFQGKRFHWTLPTRLPG